MAAPRRAQDNGLDLTDADAFGRWYRQKRRKANSLALATVAATPHPLPPDRPVLWAGGHRKMTMHAETLYALALFHQREAEERARIYRITKQARTPRRTGASAPQKRQHRLTRPPRPVCEAA